MRILMTFALVFVTLAGCAGDAPADEAEGLAPQEIQVEDRRFGAISGVVIDETIRPIVDAAVAIKGADGQETTVSSDEMGRFVLRDLDPGLYFVSAAAAGHFDAQQSVEVVAGAVAHPKIMLQVDFTPQPFHETLDFNGILRVSDWYGTYTLTLLMGNTELCECEFYFDVPDTVHSILVEGFWEPKLGDPEHELYFELETPEPLQTQAAYSTSPFHGVYPREAFDPAAKEFLVRVSSGLGADIDQEFEVFVTLFHLAPPPPGWSIAAGPA